MLWCLLYFQPSLKQLLHSFSRPDLHDWSCRVHVDCWCLFHKRHPTLLRWKLLRSLFRGVVSGQLFLKGPGELQWWQRSSLGWLRGKVELAVEVRALGGLSGRLLGVLWLPLGLNERSIRFAVSIISERSLYSSALSTRYFWKSVFALEKW